MKQLDRKQNEDRVTLAEMADELRQDSRAHKRDALAREFIENAWSMTRATPEQMELLVEAYVCDRQNARELPSLMRMFQDVANPEQEIARRCRDHMLQAAMYGQTIGIRLALGHLEELAAEIIYSPKSEWVTP